MKITLDKIDISGNLNNFAQYLETTDRIILSAKFGDGKTYLLNELRNDAVMKDKYEFFTIYPVNYSVAKNEDVFEYIKRDIIVQLHERKLLENIDLNALFGSVFTFKESKEACIDNRRLRPFRPQAPFRILNVVSAHIDDSKQPDIVGNKFGFNNIVLVMDYDVTKHIFHHFYGEQACYEGYMSKFLSREPFRYSIGPYMVRAFEEQLGEKLGIKNLLPHLTKFRERLVRCSLRDLYKLIRFDTDSYFKVPEYCYSGGSMPTSLPLFHLIIYMMESGMSVKEIQIELDALNKFIDQNFNGYLGEWEIIRLMYPVYITQYPKRQYIKVHNSNYHFWLERTKEGGNVIINKADKLSKNSPIISIEEEDIGKIIKPFIEYLSIFVNLSALRLD